MKPQFANLIDAFLAVDKRLAGADVPMVWQQGGNIHEAVVKLPIEVDGELRGASLMMTAYPRESSLKYRLQIIFPPVICRLDYADETHANAHAMPGDGVSAIVRGAHYHSWALNRRFFKGAGRAAKLHNAHAFNGARTFDAGLRWFCGETKISLPARHEIELPKRALLP